jgi:hypothetical protein
MNPLVVHAVGLPAVVSPRTGHRIRVNPHPESVWVPMDLEMRHVDAVLASWPRAQDKDASSCTGPIQRQLMGAQAPHEFAAMLTRLLSDESLRRGEDIQHILLWLWAHDVIALPAQGAHAFAAHSALGPLLLGPKWDWLAVPCTFCPAIASDLVRLASTAIGAGHLMDLLPATVDRRALPGPKLRTALLRVLTDAQVAQCGRMAHVWTKGWHGALPKPPRHRRTDPEFRWVLDRDPSCEAWRAALADWVAPQERPAQACAAGSLLLDYVLSHPDVTRDPATFCSRDYRPPETLRAYLRRRLPCLHTQTTRNNSLNRFFASWLEEAGLRHRSAAGLVNPLPLMKGTAGASQSPRDRLPTKLVNALIALLCDDGFAWPQSLKADRMRGDGGWCPVRAVALLLMLLLPWRSSQVRFLESDEGDHERHTPEGWVTVPGRRRRPCRGVLRRKRLAGRDAMVLFANTSKTYDHTRHADDPGHEIWWVRTGAIELIHYLQKWQREHNPVTGPTEWKDLHDRRMVRMGQGALARRPPAWFLMRDPLGKHANEPLTYPRLNDLWMKTMEELDRRIQDGRVDPDLRQLGRLVEDRSALGLPARVRFDLHSLRVTGITALIEDGGMDPALVARYVAGHATPLMTLRYVKCSEAAITAKFDAAEKNIDRATEIQFLRYCQEAKSRDWMPVAAAFSLSPPLRALAAAGGLGGLSLCPTAGCERCRNGSPCRGAVSGPAFVPALAMHLCGLDHALRAAVLDYREQERHAQELETAWVNTGGQGTQPDGLARAIARSEEAAAIWRGLSSARCDLRQRIDQCLALLEDRGPAQLHLILPASQASAVCDEVKDGVRCVSASTACVAAASTSDPLAAPTFLQMTETQARVIGDEVTALLLRLSGRSVSGGLLGALLGPASPRDDQGLLVGDGHA